MELGITTLTIASEAFFPELDAYRGFELIAEYGYTHVELSDSTKPSFLDPSEAELAKLRAHADDLGLTLWAAHSPVTWTNLTAPDPDHRAYSIDVHKRCIDGLAALGVRHFVIHPVESGEPEDYDEKLRLGLDAVMRLRAHAKQYDMMLLLENLPFFAPEDLLDMMSLAGPEGLGAVIDIGHEWMKGRDPCDALAMTADHLMSLHIHDNHGKGAADEHLPPTWGTVNWADVIRTLELLDYSGPYIIEVLPITPQVAEMTPQEILTVCRNGMQQVMEVACK